MKTELCSAVWKRQFVFLLPMVFFLASCSGDSDSEEEEQVLAPRNLQVTVDVKGSDGTNPYGDGSGQVEFKATAENAVSYKIKYDDREFNMNNGSYTMTFEDPGVNTYDVEVMAYNSANVSVKKAVPVEVARYYEVPADLMTLLTADDKKEWRIKNETAGHMGVGPSTSNSPEWWIAQAYEKDYTSMYDDRYVLKADFGFSHDTEDFVYGQADPLTNDLGGIQDPPNADNEYENYPFGSYAGEWFYSESNGRQRIHLSDPGFFGFYVGGDHVYEIIRKSDTDLELKTVGADGNGWFFILSAEEEVEIPEDPEYTNLVWEDNFDVNGKPNSENWGYDIGTGQNGWGNNEKQYYTNRLDNASVENGVLSITAKKEGYQGSEYTSARLLTQDKYEFTYGRVEIRAKLAGGGGTWPAIWMLGANFPDVGWPACGEIDIMEYVGNNPGFIQSALHNPSSYGNTVNKKTKSISNETDEFHIYSMVWSEEQISFYLDGERYYTYRPAVQDGNNWPYDNPQFLILNVAMGGTLGGDIDPTFTESTMEIDYVRIYQ